MNTMKRQVFAPHARGFTLVELMVGLVVGMIVLAAATAAFLSVSSARREMERTDRQIENGRYAMQLLTDDISLAGYWGEFDPTVVAVPASMAAGTSGDPCVTDNALLKVALPLHVEGYDLGASAPSCVSDVKANTDIIVVRRASTCVAGASGCDVASAGTTYVQSTLCDSELALPTIAQRYVVSSTLADFTLSKRPCVAGTADLRKYVVHIYFVANNNVAGDGVPTLKRAELGGGAFSVVPLVEGIDNLQVDYAIDTDGNGSPNVYSADPSTYAGCAGAGCLVNWSNVMGMKLYVLARSTDVSAGYLDTKAYPAGLKADGTAQELGPFNDGFKRHAFTSMVRINNAAGRRE